MVVSETRGGVESDYISDPLGSTIGLMNSSGTMTDRWEYWPYGEVVSRTGTSVTPLTFLGVIGYFQDVLSKLFYVRARHLRADLARWLTVDQFWPSQEPYSYTDCDPLTKSDPSGLGGWFPHGPGNWKQLPGFCTFFATSWNMFTNSLGIKVVNWYLYLCMCLDDLGLYGLIVFALISALSAVYAAIGQPWTSAIIAILGVLLAVWIFLCAKESNGLRVICIEIGVVMAVYPPGAPIPFPSCCIC